MAGLTSELYRAWLDADYQLRDPILIGCLLLLVEILISRRRLLDILKNRVPKSTRVNLCIYGFNFLVMTLPLASLALFSSTLASRNNFVLISHAVFAAMPDWAVLVFALIVWDLIVYVAHRCQHSWLLWRTHALHHSDEQVSWFTTWRFHPLERIYGVFISMALLGFIGIPLGTISLAALIFHYYSYFLHANIPWAFKGPMAKILVSPAQHRWHHSIVEKGYRANFAGMFSFFDIIFRTYYCPGPCDAPTGVIDEPKGFMKSMLRPLSPFRLVPKPTPLVPIRQSTDSSVLHR